MHTLDRDPEAARVVRRIFVVKQHMADQLPRCAGHGRQLRGAGSSGSIGSSAGNDRSATVESRT
jgi:hypothetical protein